jgi:hypothetical protein
LGEREREYPLTLAPFTLVTLFVEMSRFSKDIIFFPRDKKIVKEKKIENILECFIIFAMNFF